MNLHGRFIHKCSFICRPLRAVSVATDIITLDCSVTDMCACSSCQVRKVAQRQGRRPTGEVVRPEELEQIEEKEKQETDRNLEEM